VTRPVPDAVFRVAVLGASGYAGGELVRLVDDHPGLEATYLGANTQAGSALGEVHPHLRAPDRVLVPITADLDVDLVFMALPHGASAPLGAQLAAAGVPVADLGSDFRLDSAERYLDAYGSDHPVPDELGTWVYGLPELFGEQLAGAAKVAVPGCYPTSAVLALAPLVRDGLVGTDRLVVDSVSGVTGAGRGARPELTFGAVAEGVRAYAVTTHRHRPEMEQAIGAVAGRPVTVLFTPHLVPMQRGILSTCYAPVTDGVTAGDLVESLTKAYAAAPFVTVGTEPPQTRWVSGANTCRLAAFMDERSGTAVVLSAIDNLVKGAAGQAVQCANLMLGLDETAGLPMAGTLP
jgi:N-acetyl-gamma-glutamyl-phosphate reductase